MNTTDFAPTCRVRIIKAKIGSYWYSNKIGEIFDACPGEPNYNFPAPYFIATEKSKKWCRNLIMAEDCEQLPLEGCKSYTIYYKEQGITAKYTCNAPNFSAASRAFQEDVGKKGWVSLDDVREDYR